MVTWPPSSPGHWPWSTTRAFIPATLQTVSVHASQPSWEEAGVKIIITPIFLMRKLRLREGMELPRATLLVIGSAEAETHFS